MPTKKSRRVTPGRERRVKPAPPLAGAPVVLGRSAPARVSRPTPATPAPIAAPDEATRQLPAAGIPQLALYDAATSSAAQQLFWACYTAGVDTIRFAFDVQSAFVKQLFEVTPASLAYRYHHAFHDRALA
jgi:hypothetical protein